MRVNSTSVVTDSTGITAGVKVTAVGYTDPGQDTESTALPLALLTTTSTALESVAVCYFVKNFCLLWIC